MDGTKIAVQHYVVSEYIRESHGVLMEVREIDKSLSKGLKAMWKKTIYESKQWGKSGFWRHRSVVGSQKYKA